MDEVWKLVYASFESGFHGAVGGAAGVNAQRNELQFGIQKAIAAYKNSPSDDMLNQILADTKTANVLGFISNESQQKIEAIIEGITK